MNFIIIGMKHCGKSTNGTAIAQAIDCPFSDSDELMQLWYEQNHGETLNAKEIFAKHGADFFKDVERKAILEFKDTLSDSHNHVIALGGATPLNGDLLESLKAENGYVIFLKADPTRLFERVVANGPSRFLQGDNQEEAFLKTYQQREPFYLKHADLVVSLEAQGIEATAELIINKVKELTAPKEV